MIPSIMFGYCQQYSLDYHPHMFIWHLHTVKNSVCCLLHGEKREQDDNF